MNFYSADFTCRSAGRTAAESLVRIFLNTSAETKQGDEITLGKTHHYLLLAHNLYIFCIFCLVVNDFWARI